MKLSPSQLFALAWAARPNDSYPPLEKFGELRGRYDVTKSQPRLSRRTWRVLEANGLVAVLHYASGHVRGYAATEKGRRWLRERGLLDAALEGTDRPGDDRLPE